MTPIKTADATGAALDWLVAKIENVECDEHQVPIWFGDEDSFSPRITYTPSTDWSQGGPIFEREGLSLKNWLVEVRQQTRCEAHLNNYEGNFVAFGPTPLIAACRCFVASKLGDTVEVPEELL